MMNFLLRLALCALAAISCYPPAPAGAAITQDRWNVQQWGAKGDGAADDTAKIQAAITAVAGYGGGVLVFPKGTYRTTAAITLGDKVTLRGHDGAKLYLDYDAAAGYGLLGAGTIGTAAALTANVAIGDKTIQAANTLAAGDVVGVESTHNSGRWPVEVMTVLSATGTSVTFAQPLRVAYLTSEAATVTKYTAKTIAIDNLVIEQAPTRDIRTLVYAQYAKDVRITNCTILNHRTITNPTDQIGIQILDAASAVLTGNRLTATDGQGTAIAVSDAGSIRMVGNNIDGYDFGVVAANCAGVAITSNVVRGEAGTGRGIKIRGTQYATVVGNTVSGSGYSGLKIEDSGRASITGNALNDTGDGASGMSAINVSSVVTADADHGRHAIVGNTVSNTDGEGIYVASTDPGCVVSGNVVTDTQYRAIDAISVKHTTIANNHVVNWGTGYTGTATPYQGIIFHQTCRVIGNLLYRTDGMATPPPAFDRYFSALAPGDGTMFVGNVSTTAGTGFASMADLDKIDQFHGNVIAGLGQKVKWGTAAPAAGTFEVGDRVINSNTAPGAPLGWVCVTAGTPGTWKELAPISL